MGDDFHAIIRLIMERVDPIGDRFPSKEIVQVFSMEVDHILNKLDATIKVENVTKWLNNFADEDRISALEILDRLRFVSEWEQFGIAHGIIEEILGNVADNTLLYFCPIAKYGKSATQFSYYIAKSSAFQLLERQERAFFLMHEQELSTVIFDENSVVIFFDDFFGSGGSFVTYYEYFLSKVSLDFARVKHVFAACGLYMERAFSKITALDTRIVIIGELHDKIFGNPPAMFVSQSQIEQKKEIAKRYGDTKFLFKGRTRNHGLGYKDSEALLAFPYMPPNNTLPIIWSANGGWYPLLPRRHDDILRKLSEYKQQLSFAAAKMHLDLPPEFDQFYNVTAVKFIIFGILRMIGKKISHPQIALLMGIDLRTFGVFMKRAQDMGYVGENYLLTPNGVLVLNNVLEHVKAYKEERKKNPLTRGVKYMSKEIPRV
jgi:hypothetical protein